MPEAIPEIRDATAVERPGTQAQLEAEAAQVASIPLVAKPKESAEQRAAHARAAALARHQAKFNWETCSIDQGLAHLADLRAEGEKGGLVMQRRVSQKRVERAYCYNPNCKRGENGGPTLIDIGQGRFAGMRTRENPPGSKQYETGYACSAGCFMYLTANFSTRPGENDKPAQPITR